MTHSGKAQTMAMQTRSSVMPRDFTDHGPSVEALASVFADRDATSSEALIQAFVTQAIQKWKLDDATYWQRVKFQARLIRATRMKLAAPIPHPIR